MFIITGRPLIKCLDNSYFKKVLSIEMDLAESVSTEGTIVYKLSTRLTL
jgi:hypothetical protein